VVWWGEVLKHGPLSRSWILFLSQYWSRVLRFSHLDNYASALLLRPSTLHPRRHWAFTLRRPPPPHPHAGQRVRSQDAAPQEPTHLVSERPLLTAPQLRLRLPSFRRASEQTFWGFGESFPSTSALLHPRPSVNSATCITRDTPEDHGVPPRLPAHSDAERERLGTTNEIRKDTV